MTINLKKKIFPVVIGIAATLGLLLAFGLKQYQLHQNYEEMIKQNEMVIFQYVTIRGHITESLLENRYDHLSGISSDVESLNSNISRILQNSLIPDEYKLSFANQVDLAGIILSLKSIGSGNIEKAQIRQLNQEVRILGERLMLFDRVIVNHVKRKLISFQSVIIGTLAISVFIIINILLYVNRHLAAPLLDLIRQIKEIAAGKRFNITSLRKSGDIARLSGLLFDLFQNHNIKSQELSRGQRVLQAVNATSEALSAANSPEVISTVVCRSLLFNEDYFHIDFQWQNENSIKKLFKLTEPQIHDTHHADKSVMLLLTSRDKLLKTKPSNNIMGIKENFVLDDILTGIPFEKLKGTPLEAGKACYASFPIVYKQLYFGNLEIYSLSMDGFNGDESALLTHLAKEIAQVIYVLGIKKLLRQRNQQFINITEETKALQVQLLPDGTIIFCNSNFESYTGYNRREVIGKKWHELFFKASEQKSVQKCLAESPVVSESDQQLFDTEIVLKNNNTNHFKGCYLFLDKPLDNKATIIWTGLPPYAALPYSDGKIYQSKYEHLSESLDEAVLVTGEDGTILEANRQSCNLFHSYGNTIVGRNLFHLFDIDREMSPSHPFTKIFINKSGEVSMLLPGHDDEYLVAISKLEGTSPAAPQIILILRKLGSDNVHKARAVKACQLAALGEVATGVAHEINELSNSLINYSQILTDDMIDSDGNENQINLLEKINGQGERISHLVQRILFFNRNQSQKMEHIQIEKVIDETISLMKNQLKNEGIKINMNFPSKLPSIQVNTQQMQHVFLNLLSNARYALNLKYPGKHDNKKVEVNGDILVKNGQQWLTASFVDRGTGIEAEDIPRLCEPFFSTKPPDQGTGLGLSICHGLIKNHNGEIRFDSVPNDYTAVTVELPVNQDYLDEAVQPVQ